MEGQLKVTFCGVNIIHGNVVYSDATTTHHEHGSWFNSWDDVNLRVQELEEDEGFLGVTWVYDTGEEESL